jgi:nicotinate phosphoribosyltransferase
MVAHYRRLGIDPLSKTIVFSNALRADVDVPVLQAYCQGKIGCSFGIGTNLTNDFGPESPALNMVIKLTNLDGVPVVKLSDDRSKECGDRDALRVARWTFFNTPLDT